MAGNDLAAFVRNMRRIGGAIPLALNDVKRELAREIVTPLVPATPVLTGKARSNWRVSNGTPISGTVEPPAISTEGAPSLRSLDRAYLTARPGVPMYVASNIPYIRRLNTGWSQQQPVPGYVERIVAQGNRKFPVILSRVWAERVR